MDAAGPVEPASGRSNSPWLATLRRYLAFVAVANLLWEFAHLPLYTIWTEGDAGEIVFAALHCTGGDVLIAASALMVALLLAGEADWPLAGYARVASLSLLFGLGYTLFSEWLNTAVRGSWAYAELMPTLPLIGAGLSPVLQWIVIPLAGFVWARRPLAARSRLDPPRSDTAMSRDRLVIPVLLAALAASGEALAHAHLATAMPAAGTTVSTAPRELRLQFSEGIEPAFSSVQITGPDGKNVTVSDMAADPKDRKVLVVTFPTPLSPGRYTVDWQVISVDSHRTRGSYTFVVKP
jgi:methionine-rich copper-binding protein CopC